MKIHSLVLASVLSTIGITAVAQDSPVAQVRRDNAVIRRDNHEIGHEKRDIQRDNAGISEERHDIARDKNTIGLERRDARRDQRLEDAYIAKGDLRDAQRMEKMRQHENNEIRHARQDIRQDRGDIARLRNDRHHEAAALKDERLERNAAVARRNRDAASIR